MLIIKNSDGVGVIRGMVVRKTNNETLITIEVMIAFLWISEPRVSLRNGNIGLVRSTWNHPLCRYRRKSAKKEIEIIKAFQESPNTNKDTAKLRAPLER
jgi:hypothetical protein